MTKRVFLGIWPSYEVLVAIKDLQDNLRKQNLPIVWTEIEKVHLTLNFLGKMPHHDINEIIKNIREACEGLPAFTLKFPFLETLYKKHDESLIYLSVEGEVEALQRTLTEVVTDVAAQPKRYLPHITIGRVKKLDPETTKQTLNAVSDLQLKLNIPSMKVDKFSLY